MKTPTRSIFGIEPLYYIRDKNGQMHSNTSINPLLGFLDKKEVNPFALNHYLAFRCTPEDQTMFNGIKKVPPGCSLINGEIKRYWDIKYEEKNDGSELFEHMRHAVRRRIGKKQGIFLSGGMDSSTILALCDALGKQNLKTFTAGFDVPGHDERKEAEQTASHFNTTHKEIELSKNSFKVWPKLVNIFEEPMADPTKLPVYFLCKKASRTCRSILVGEGGDENFAAYHQYKFMRMHKYIKMVPFSLLRMMPKFLLNKFFRYAAELGDAGIDRFKRFADEAVPGLQYQNLVSIFNNQERAQLLKHEYKSLDFNPAINNINDMVRTDIRAIMAEDLMMKMHKNASYFGIEGRFPFLDKGLFEYTACMKMNIRLKGKDIMKKTMKDVLPDFVLSRKKSRFFVPIHKWGIDNIFADIMTEQNTKGYFSWDHILKIIKGYKRSPLFYARQMFALIDFMIWKRIFIDGESPKKIQEEI